MFTIIHTASASCEEAALMIANSLGDSRTLDFESILNNPGLFDNFENLGFVFEKEGRGVPRPVISFISEILGGLELNALNRLDYLFSVCVCGGGAGYALKIVERLCRQAGCAPSLSMALSEAEVKNPSAMTALASKIKNGYIELAKGAFGTDLYMRLHGIRIK